MDHLLLDKAPLSLDEVYQLVSDPACGAVSYFVGVTRDSFEGRRVLQLEYEAYESMALKQMKSVCGELREKHPNVRHVAIHHRSSPQIEA